ncbi:hypothetical protein Fmac_011528 [Flemingia macrophylla]|uniref:Uncharacterized protein n=1 Tax=Flemingia macrophylla TaxID=520843 RepID=A0ABD1MNK0_9FABA
MEEQGRGKRVKHIASKAFPRSSPRNKKKEETSKRGSTSQSQEQSQEEVAKASNPWFSTKVQETIFNESFASKELIPPKILEYKWLEEQGFIFHSLLKAQNLQKFTSLKGNIYPDLVRVFYSNLYQDGRTGNLTSEVKGTKLIRLRNSCWTLAARGSNHAQISEDDMILMAALKNNITLLIGHIPIFGWVPRDEVPPPVEEDEQAPAPADHPSTSAAQPSNHLLLQDHPLAPAGFLPGEYKPKTPFEVMALLVNDLGVFLSRSSLYFRFEFVEFTLRERVNVKNTKLHSGIQFAAIGELGLDVLALIFDLDLHENRHRIYSPPPLDSICGTNTSNHPWFSTKAQERIFNESFASKELISPKILHKEWLMQQGFQFHNLLDDQGLWKFVSLSGFYYPDLVRVFYANLHSDPITGYLCSEVKRTRILLSLSVMLSVSGLKNTGLIPRVDPLKSVGFVLNKEEFYIGSNHAQISEEDMLLLGALTNKLILNWIHVIAETMLKTRRLVDYKCPYVVFFSRLIDHYKVDTNGEARELTKEVHDVKEKALKMMRLAQTVCGWIPKEYVPLEAEEDAPPPADAEDDVPPSTADPPVPEPE